MTNATQTSRFAIIDFNSGFVWGVTDAADPVAACRVIDKAVDSSAAAERGYVEHGQRSGLSRSGISHYAVYKVPAGFDVTDGQSADEIAAVEACDYVADVEIVDPEIKD